MRILLLLLALGSVLGAPERRAVIDNGVVRRVIECKDGRIGTESLSLNGTEFVRADGREFSFLADGRPYTGDSGWTAFDIQENTRDDGSAELTVRSGSVDGKLSLTLTYRTFPGLPLIQKRLAVRNTGSEDLCLEAVNVEDFPTTLDPIESWVLHQYARYRTVGAYTGNWDDPLLVIHDHSKDAGLAIGSEAPGVLKRITAFQDGRSITAGLTRPEDAFPFRRWLRPGQAWESPAVFTAPYYRCSRPETVVETVVQDYVRRWMGTRIAALAEKPTFVYNTWYPFMRDIDEQKVMELADAAAECGVEEFVIDDGWQLNVHSPAGKPEYMGDWEVDPRKFPNGLKPVFDHIKSLGMKPGLWISLATADPSSIPFREHPEWFVQDASGRPSDLHNPEETSRTACFGTPWYDYIKETILRLRREYGLAYVKLDLAVLSSAYVYEADRTGCYATDHPLHRDRAESYAVIYARCLDLFDELHREAPELFIDCTFETAGKFHLMDYGFARHADGNWLSNVPQDSPVGSLRVRELAWKRTPAVPPASLVIGNLRMDDPDAELALQSLAGTLPIMLGDPRELSAAERARFKRWADWMKAAQRRYAYMDFRQDLPGFGEPREGAWDGFCRINTETRGGGIVGVFRQGAAETARQVFVPYLDPEARYQVLEAPSGKRIRTMTGRELAEKGFRVKLDRNYSGALFEVSLVRP